MRYFVGNWKMFGVPNSIGILNKINRFVSKDKNNKKYRVLVSPPFTLLESFSKILDWSDRSTSVLFGDGAGAFVLEKCNENSEWGILSSNFYSNGNFSNILHTDGGPSINLQVGKVRMNGKEVFKHAVEKLSSCLIEAMNSANLKIQDIDFLVPHQANLRIIEALSKKLDIPINKIINTVDVHANTSAASIPLAFDSALEKRIIKNGDIIAFNAIGGGLSWGASIIKYGKPD